MRLPLNMNHQYRQILALNWASKEAAFLQFVRPLNWVEKQAAFLFNQISYDLMEIIDYPSDRKIISLNFWQFTNILRDYPGSYPRKTFKYWQDEHLNKICRAPLDISKSDLVVIAEKFLKFYGEQESTTELADIKEEWKPYFMTAQAIMAFLVETPSVARIAYQIAKLPPGTFVSPLDGQFYRRPDPEQPVLTEKGNIVEANQDVCVVVASKTNNYLQIGERARIVAFLVEDGAKVQAGDPIIRFEPIAEE